MTRTIDLAQTADKTDTGAVDFPVLSGGSGGTRKKVPAHGQFNWSMTSVAKTAGGAPNLVVVLKGTNNPDEADLTGETLITNTHAAANSQHGSAANKAWKYIFVDVTASTDLDLDSVFVFGSGMAGTH